MNKFTIWLSAIRPRTLPLSVSGIIVGTALAYYDGSFDWWLFVLTIFTTISLQILSNLANDYGDGIKGTDNEQRIGPTRVIQSGEISPEKMLNAIRISILFVIFFVMSSVFTAFGIQYITYSIIFFVLGGIAVYAAIKYTVGKSAYGYRALGDVMVFIFFGIVSVMGTYFLHMKELNHAVILPSTAIGLLSMAVLNLNNMRDIVSDEAVGKITVAVKLGFNRAKLYHRVLVIGGMMSALLFGILYYRSPFHFLMLIAFIPLIKHLIFVRKNTDPRELDSQLKIVALSTFLMAILLSLGHLYSTI